ncbi:MAG: DUF3842 family protein [Firmicutes bacterium]|nr:DUF3842 family protein [Bacillota bacterium]
MKIAVIDGQGGGIGKHIMEKLRAHLPEDTELIALGTNSLATAQMIKAGASEGATGENAICYTSRQVDYITGTISIMTANAMLGEITPKIAEAIGSSPAKKYLLPLNKNDIKIIGVGKEPLPHLIEELVEAIKNDSL